MSPTYQRGTSAYGYVVKTGDTGRSLAATLLGGDGAPQDLAYADGVRFRMRLRTAAPGEWKVDAPAEIVDPPAGRVRYVWTPLDLNAPGEFVGEFVVTLAGAEITFPASDPPGDYIHVRVIESV